MKQNQSLVLSAFGMAFIAGSSVASAFFTNFESGYTVGNLVGQNGWASTSSTADVGAVLVAGGPFGGAAGSIGFVNPVDINNSFVYQTTSTPLVGAQNASFSALFQVQDSSSIYGAGAEIRDTFGFQLQNVAGDNLFSFYLTPFDQDSNPQTDTNFNTYSWSTGVGAPTTVLTGLAAQELFAYTFTVNFFDAGAGNVGFNANLNNIDFFSGTLTGLPADKTIDKFGAIWNTTAGGANSGSNFMIFDNVSLIPEPSSALLGLFGASCAFLRRRRA